MHVIDLHKTIAALDRAESFVQNLSQQGKKILFVGTKTQAKDAVQQGATRLRMPYVSERWLGGMLTNFATMRRTMRQMQSMDRLMREPAYQNLAKRERLMMQRERIKRQKMLGGILELNRLPDALFVVDVNKEKIAVQEAQTLNIPIIAMVDTNANPTPIDYPIPANDDSIQSIEEITEALVVAISAGSDERKKAQKAKPQAANDDPSAPPLEATDASSVVEAPPSEKEKSDQKSTKRRRIGGRDDATDKAKSEKTGATATTTATAAKKAGDTASSTSKS